MSTPNVFVMGDENLCRKCTGSHTSPNQLGHVFNQLPEDSHELIQHTGWGPASVLDASQSQKGPSGLDLRRSDHNLLGPPPLLPSMKRKQGCAGICEMQTGMSHMMDWGRQSTIHFLSDSRARAWLKVQSD